MSFVSFVSFVSVVCHLCNRCNIKLNTLGVLVFKLVRNWLKVSSCVSSVGSCYHSVCSCVRTFSTLSWQCVTVLVCVFYGLSFVIDI